MMTTCREAERLKGGSYPKSCPTCRFGPCPNGVGDWGPKVPSQEAARRPRKAFVVTTDLLAAALQHRLPEDWIVLAVGQGTIGLRLDDVVIAEDFSRQEYKSATWMEMRRQWFETLKTRMMPDATGLRITAQSA